MDVTTTGLRAAALALALAAVLAPDAGAAPITYSTEGRINQPFRVDVPTQQITGPNVLAFQGVNDQSFNAPGVFNLGDFVITPTGSDTTYSKVPFAIQFTAPEFHRVEPGSDGSPPTQYDGVFTVYGFIDGTVGLDGAVALTMTLDSIQPWDLQGHTADRTYLSGLPFSVSDVKLPTSWRWVTAAGAGPHILSLPAQVVPEPASLAVFGLVAAGLILHRRRRATA